MSIGNKMKTIGENLMAVYDAAFVRGENHGKAVCQGVHYTASVMGSGTRRMEFAIPFEPDLFILYSTSTAAEQVPGSDRGVIMDFRACGKYCGNALTCNSTGVAGSMVLPVNYIYVLFQYDNGVLSYEPPVDKLPDVVFRKDIRYNIMAVKYLGEDGAMLLRERIALLPDVVPQGSSDTLTYNREAVERHMTPEEWEELIATKPNWSFVMT